MSDTAEESCDDISLNFFETEKIENAKKISLEMLIQRGYVIIENTLCIVAQKEENELIYVFFMEPNLKFNKDRIHDYLNLMNKKKINHIIIVHETKITPSAKKIIDNLYDKKIELFLYDELQFNITKHILQPKFEQKSLEESKFIKTHYGTDFPILLRTDPISRFYNYNFGDIISVTKRDTGIVHFRIVK